MNRQVDVESDIRVFHRKFGLLYSGPPRTLPRELFDFRFKFMMEELGEYYTAVESGTREQMFDALLDLVYVAVGTCHLHGFPFNEGWQRVQRANMKKVRGKSKRSKVDVIKPKGWVHPNLSDLV